MHRILLIATASALIAADAPAAVVPVDVPTVTVDVAHGGGCRKSSPPGQCCHMEKKVGKVHCH
ncbi:MAG: hypothetical protein CML66_14850 [Rhodobacteraceae bacterium]|nr:hypothetical protein [Paracoccaceae bacterium]QEW18401.1 hypothetical protein LA6_000564 [Marinibacterium anthonyi]|tara:strand:- start:98 stop:286 length:189 start_codon:yes stop_codon:yes gene_type:complete